MDKLPDLFRLSLAKTECGYFQTVHARGPIGKNLPISWVLTQIRKGTWRKEIAKLRSLKDAGENAGSPEEREAIEDEYQRRKEDLPAFMISGTTVDGYAAEVHFGVHNGRLQADIDGLPSLQAAKEFCALLRLDPYIEAAFVSPSGRGVKAIVKIPVGTAGHKQAWSALAEYFRQKYGKSICGGPKNPASKCFVSHDPDLWWKEAEEFPVAEYLLRAENTEPGGLGEEVPLSAANCVTVPLDAGHCATATCTMGTESLGTAPCVRFNASVIREELAFEKSHPHLAKIQERLVGKFLPVIEGERNTTLTCEIVPRLFGAMSYGAAECVLTHYLAADLLGGYPREETREKFIAAWKGLENSFTTSLNGTEGSYYAELAGSDCGVYREGFRILKGLSDFDDPKYPPPLFFLSSRDFAARLNLVTSSGPRQAWEMLRRYVKWGIIEVVSTGGARGGNSPLAGKAAEFSWKLCA
jgi:hypothetical protein